MSKNKQYFTMKYYKIEINKTEWEVPDRYQMLTPVGLGAYGQVWYNIQAISALLFLIFNRFHKYYSSAVDNQSGLKVAIKKLARPFQSAVHAKRTYRELRMLKHMNHENVLYKFINYYRIPVNLLLFTN